MTYQPGAGNQPSHYVRRLLLAFDHGGEGTEVLNATVGTGTQKAVVYGRTFQLLSRLELHVVQHGKELSTVSFGHFIQGRDTFVNGNACTGIGTISNARCNVFGTISHFLIENGLGIAVKLFPCFHSLVPCFTLGGIFAVLEVGKSDFIRSDKSGTAAHLDTEVRECQTSFHTHVTHGRTGILHRIAGSARSGHLCHDVKGYILGGSTLGQCTFDIDSHGLGLALKDGLRGQYLRYLTGTDTHGDSTYRTMGRGVRVTANNGHTRQ